MSAFVPQHIIRGASYCVVYQYLWLICCLLILGLCSTQTVFAQSIKTIEPPKIRPLLNRDPCEYPKRTYCTQPDDVKIGRYLLKIPHNLIGQWPPDNDFIELLPRWPGLEGRVADKNIMANFDTFDVVHILIHTIRKEQPTAEGIQSYIQRSKLSSPISLEIGLLEYRNPASNRVWTYVPINQTGLLPKGQPLFINTTVGPFVQGDDNTIECQFGYTTRDSLYVTVRFSKRHIKDWKTIVIAVNNLVESFIQE
jgi:hypothetical protein